MKHKPSIVAAGVVLIGYGVFAYLNPSEALHHAPSHWLGFRTEDVSELLGWLGLFGLLLAIVQLIQTKTAANAALQAAKEAIAHIQRFDVIMHLATSIKVAEEIADAIRARRLQQIVDGCAAILDQLVSIDVHRDKLGAAHAGLVRPIIANFASIQDSGEAWLAAAAIPNVEGQAVLSSIASQKLELIRIREATRAQIPSNPQ